MLWAVWFIWFDRRWVSERVGREPPPNSIENVVIYNVGKHKQTLPWRIHVWNMSLLTADISVRIHSALDRIIENILNVTYINVLATVRTSVGRS